jgi:hypothetical protein
MNNIKEIKRLLNICSKEQRNEIFKLLREEFSIHPIEAKYNASAEVILEAIDRSSDLTQRGIRGIVAEAVFAKEVVERLSDWKSIISAESLPFDFLLRDQIGDVRVQIKLQRSKNKQPLVGANGMYKVETQRTRGGKDKSTGQNTRPYRFKDFDILGVCLQPSTSNWNTFMYTVSNWLIPQPNDQTLLNKFQPVPSIPNDDWTDNFLTAVDWFRSGRQKRIQS